MPFELGHKFECVVQAFKVIDLCSGYDCQRLATKHNIQWINLVFQFTFSMCNGIVTAKDDIMNKTKHNISFKSGKRKNEMVENKTKNSHKETDIITNTWCK